MKIRLARKIRKRPRRYPFGMWYTAMNRLNWECESVFDARWPGLRAEMQVVIDTFSYEMADKALENAKAKWHVGESSFVELFKEALSELIRKGKGSNVGT